MKKQFIMLVGLLPVSLTGFAAAPSPFDGFYGGLSAGGVLGYFSETGNAQLNLDYGPRQLTFEAPVDTHTSNLALFGGAQAGFGHVFNRFYLGMEANGYLGSVDATTYPELTNSTGDLTANVKNTTSIQNNYGLTFRPGFLITPTLMLYGQAGLEWAQIDFDSTTTFGNIPSTNQTYSISSSTAGTQMGYRAGIGLEKIASNHLSLRVEYDFTAFSAMDTSNQLPVTGPGLTAASNMTQSATLTPYMHSIMVSMNYYV